MKSIREQLRNAILEDVAIGSINERIIREDSNEAHEDTYWIITESQYGLKSIYSAHIICGTIKVSRVGIQKDMLDVLTN